MKNSHPSTAPIHAIVRGELSPARRWGYRVMLVVVSIMLALLMTLWLTEPGPLPGRLHVAFAALSSIALGWIGVLVWILTRRSCPTAIDRLATNWMATLACCVFLAVSLSIATHRGDTQAIWGLGVTGLGLLSVALFLLRRSFALRARLQEKLAQLEAISRPSLPRRDSNCDS